MKRTECLPRQAEELPAVEEFTAARIAEFLLNNAVDADDERWAEAAARRIGVDPATVPRGQA